MRFSTFLNDAAGRVMTVSVALFLLGGAMGSLVSPRPATHAFLSTLTALGVTVGTAGLVRATSVAPGWALASLFAVAYPMPVFYLLELIAIDYGLPIEYALLPAAGFLFWFAGWHGRSGAERAVAVAGKEVAHGHG